MHAHPPHAPEGLKDFLKAMFATFVGLLMALALESWHQNHRAESLAHMQLQEVKAELRANLDNLRELDKELSPLVESYKQAEAYLKATPAERKGMIKPIISGREYNFVWSAWDAAVAMGIQKYLKPGPNRKLGDFYAEIRRFQDIQDRSLLDQVQFYGDWREDWDQLTAQEFRSMKHGAELFMFLNRDRVKFSRSKAQEIEALLKEL